MGMFRRKKREPIVPPPVERTIYVKTTLGGSLPHINDYGRLLGSRARGLGTKVVVTSSASPTFPPTG